MSVQKDIHVDYLDGLFSDITVETVHKKKKKCWVIKTEFISAEGSTKEEAVGNLAKELRYLAENLEATLK